MKSYSSKPKDKNINEAVHIKRVLLEFNIESEISFLLILVASAITIRSSKSNLLIWNTLLCGNDYRRSNRLRSSLKIKIFVNLFNHHLDSSKKSKKKINYANLESYTRSDSSESIYLSPSFIYLPFYRYPALYLWHSFFVQPHISVILSYSHISSFFSLYPPRHHYIHF